MTDAHIRKGRSRTNYTMVYHELFDLYHPYIGDKATLLYTYLLRSRNNEEDNSDYGKSWRGRKGIAEKFQLSFSTLPLIDDILVASGLIAIETRPSGRGREKIYYTVNDPLEREEFRKVEAEIEVRLRVLAQQKGAVASLFGKDFKKKLTGE
ncbi:hypothetical protein GJU41_11715 [Bacillus idriensis]|uniref:Uncharacterized protein n=1 Tax=Metabacillus idriensis TaxID=324768 RepID=A0A6I2MA20_9BACI|nr:hypothetical protein [Metabacillus idriensis]MRX54639.1 hypothetical protein [Metabacillus idriensis]